MRDTPDPVAVQQAVQDAAAQEPPASAGPRARVADYLRERAASPWAFDYFALMRRLEALAQPAPRWGHALLPGVEPL
ncbi:MAG: hypothetical protein JSS56_28550, partial [Proteobacteria bacterium]|nr:hypothetical protein [Pseudomonadota bacterium]